MPAETIIIALSVAYGVFLVFVGFAVALGRDRVGMRLDHYGRRVRTLEDVELEQPLAERVFKPALRNIARLMLRLTPQLSLDAVRLRLDMAGNPYAWTPIDFLGIRGLSGAVCVVLVFASFSLAGLPLTNLLLVTVAAGGIGLYLPVVWLNGQIGRRRKQIQHKLPDAIDLITVSVEAGLALEAAMAKVAREQDDEVARGFAQMLSQIQIGRSRAEAMRDMALRAGVQELTSFVTAILQAEQLGVNIAKVLRIQSDMMRIQRRQRAEEEAQRAPVKMSVVLVLLLLPALMLVIMGPSVPRICKQFYPNNSWCAY